MKLNNVDLNLLSHEDLKKVCIKYKIITDNEASTMTKEALERNSSFIIHKMNKYKSRPR